MAKTKGRRNRSQRKRKFTRKHRGGQRLPVFETITSPGYQSMLNNSMIPRNYSLLQPTSLEAPLPSLRNTFPGLNASAKNPVALNFGLVESNLRANAPEWKPSGSGAGAGAGSNTNSVGSPELKSNSGSAYGPGSALTLDPHSSRGSPVMNEARLRRMSGTRFTGRFPDDHKVFGHLLEEYQKNRGLNFNSRQLGRAWLVWDDIVYDGKSLEKNIVYRKLDELRKTHQL